MANAKPTHTQTINASAIGSLSRRKGSPIDKLGSIPAVVYDPDMMQVSHVIQHGTGLSASAQHLTPKEAVGKKVIEFVEYGDQRLVYIKSRSTQVVLVPAVGLMRALQARPAR